MQRVSVLVRVYWISTMVAAGALVVLSSEPNLGSFGLPPILFFLLLALSAEAAPVTLPRGGTVSVSFPVIYSAGLIFGPGIAMLVGGLGSVSVGELRRIGKDLPLSGFFFNRAQLALTAGLSAYTFQVAGGTFGSFNLLRDFLPAVLGGLVYFVVNSVLVTLSLALQYRMSFWGIWVVNMRPLSANYLALIPMAFLIGVVFRSVGYMGVLFFLIPLLVARFAFQRYMDVRSMFLGTIRALTQALEAKDEYTSGHGDRVASISVEVARQLRWSEDRLEILQYAGILHDVGKIGVEDQVLNKPGKFTESEYQLMKKHAEMGANIIAGIEALGQGADWLRYHHERYDGSGYPFGLRSEEIPMGARIIAVADAFDAMISKRPYRDASTVEEAMEEIRVCRGTQFDPEVVDAFLEVMKKPEIIKALGRRVPSFPKREVAATRLLDETGGPAMEGQ